MLCADSHCTVPGDPYYSAGYVNGWPNFLSWDTQSKDDYDMVVLLGDVAHDSDDMVNTVSAKLLTMSNYIVAVGNHDIGPDYVSYPDYPLATYAARAAALPALYGISALNYALDVGFCRVVVLNACYDDADNPISLRKGYLPDAQIAWLQAEIAAMTKDAMVVFMHHPPKASFYGDANEWFDATDLAAFQAALDTVTHAVVVSAHLHAAEPRIYPFGQHHLYILRPLTTGYCGTLDIRKKADGKIGYYVDDVSL